MRARGLIVVLVVIGLLGSAALASGSPLPRRGEIFDATAESGHGEDAVRNQFELRVSRDKRNVSVPSTQIGVSCTAGPSKGEGPQLNVPTTRARIAAGRTVSMALATNDGGRAPKSPGGKLVSLRRFSGTLTFGGGRQDPQCDARLKVIARLRDSDALPDRPVRRADHGREQAELLPNDRHTATGGWSRRPLGGGSVPWRRHRGEGDRHGPGVIAAIRDGAFRSDDEEDESSEAFTFAGRFSDSMTAAGTLGSSGRDDFSFSGLGWSAKRVGPRPTVTVASH